MLPVRSGLPPSPRAWGALVATATVLLLAGCTTSRPAGPTDAAPPGSQSTTRPAVRSAPSSPDALRAAVTAGGIRRHLVALQRIADRHGGNRAAGTPGYDAAVAYVAEQLRASGYKPQLQRYDSPDDSTTPPARNLVADLAGARSNHVVMIGAHLDSVPAGPGINDNASGSAMVLELAQQLANARLPATVRFAWWDGEEPGQLGSSRYVAALDPADRDRIMLYLNLDMVGSPNFTRLVYAGDGDHVPPGSKVVEQHLIDYFRTQGLAADLLEPGEGSDHAAFADAGIPVGGLFTGTDPCYHQACDDLTNIDPVALDQMADAAADAVMRFAQDPAALDRAKARG